MTKESQTNQLYLFRKRNYKVTFEAVSKNGTAFHNIRMTSQRHFSFSFPEEMDG